MSRSAGLPLRACAPSSAVVALFFLIAAVARGACASATLSRSHSSEGPASLRFSGRALAAHVEEGGAGQASSNELIKGRGALDALKRGAREDIYDELEQLNRKVKKKPAFLDEAMEINSETIRKIGVNGVLDIIEAEEPGCHSTAHQVGRAAVRITNDVVKLLQACGSRCGMGCFHGVALGLIVDAGAGDAAEDKQRVLRSLCEDQRILESYGVGECLHAAGHVAIMISKDHDPGLAEDFCMGAFEGNGTMQHYCGTGLHMQAHPKDPIHTCKKTSLPGACFMYGWRSSYISSRHVEGVKLWAELQREHCLKLKGPEALRLGCIFGLGSDAGERIILDKRVHLGDVALRDATEVVKDVCLELKDGEMLSSCVEGFLLRNNKYYPEGAAEAICEAMQVAGAGVEYSREDCMDASRLTQYDMARRVARYVAA